MEVESNEHKWVVTLRQSHAKSNGITSPLDMTKELFQHLKYTCELEADEDDVKYPQYYNGCNNYIDIFLRNEQDVKSIKDKIGLYPFIYKNKNWYEVIYHLRSIRTIEEYSVNEIHAKEGPGGAWRSRKGKETEQERKRRLEDKTHIYMKIYNLSLIDCERQGAQLSLHDNPNLKFTDEDMANIIDFLDERMTRMHGMNVEFIYHSDVVEYIEILVAVDEYDKIFNYFGEDFLRSSIKYEALDFSKYSQRVGPGMVDWEQYEKELDSLQLKREDFGSFMVPGTTNLIRLGPNPQVCNGSNKGQKARLCVLETQLKTECQAHFEKAMQESYSFSEYVDAYSEHSIQQVRHAVQFVFNNLKPRMEAINDECISYKAIEQILVKEYEARMYHTNQMDELMHRVRESNNIVPEFTLRSQSVFFLEEICELRDKMIILLDEMNERIKEEFKELARMGDEELNRLIQELIPDY